MSEPEVSPGQGLPRPGRLFAARWFKLEAADTQNPRLLELLAYSDCVVLGRLLCALPALEGLDASQGIANAIARTGVEPIRGLMNELAHLAQSGLEVTGQEVLGRHITGMCVTVRRLAVFSQVHTSLALSLTQLQQLAVLSKLGCAQALARGGPHADALLSMLQAGHHDFHLREALHEPLRAGYEVARAWGADMRLLSALQELAKGPDDEALTVQLMCAAELALEAQAHRASRARLASSSNPILHRILARGLDPASLALLF